MVKRDTSPETAKEHAAHDVVSDAEFCVLHSPEFYKDKYNRICDEQDLSDEIRRAYMEGIDMGFDEAL